MPNFAIHDGTTVLNVIVADSLDIAEQVTGMSALETEGAPWIGWTLEAEGWRALRPFTSWEWNGEAWAAPIAYPQDDADYFWNEATQEWVEIVEPDRESSPASEE
jgi:hypothetical protein